MIMPSFNKSTIVATLCAISLFLSFPAKSAADYRIHDCSNTTTYTANSTYQSNLNLLLSSLTSNASLGGLFHNATVGRDTDEAAYGSIMCRGDLTPQECQTCVAAASRQLVETICPVEKVAIVWFDECVVRYSNESFFGVRNEWPRVNKWKLQNVYDPKGTFSQLVGETTRDVAAAAAASSNRFAVLRRNFSNFQSLYSTAQCTPDISPLDCSMCLTTAIAIFPSCCDWKKGGRVLFPSCNVRFELNQFYNVTGAASSNTPPAIPPPPPLPSAIGSEGN